jgi:hypothetical protein
MTPADERQPWELAGDAAESGAPVNPTNEPRHEDEEREPEAATAHEEADVRSEGQDTGPLDDEEPPPERTHEEEGAVGAGSQYAAEDARDDDHGEPRGPAGAA